MDKETHSTKPRKNATGYVLIGVCPLMVVGGVFAAGSLEEGGNKIVGWLWIPFAIFVMIVVGIIHYSITRARDQRFSFGELTKCVLRMVLKQILVILVLGLIAMLLARLNPFSSMGNNW